jgi:hypothetical protein
MIRRINKNCKQKLHIIGKGNHPVFAGVVIAQGKGLMFNCVFGALIYIGKMFAS